MSLIKLAEWFTLYHLHPPLPQAAVYNGLKLGFCQEHCKTWCVRLFFCWPINVLDAGLGSDFNLILVCYIKALPFVSVPMGWRCFRDVVITDFSLGIWTRSSLQLLLMCISRQQQNVFCNRVFFNVQAFIEFEHLGLKTSSVTHCSFSSLLHTSKSLQTQGPNRTHFMEPLLLGVKLLISVSCNTVHIIPRWAHF